MIEFRLSALFWYKEIFKANQVRWSCLAWPLISIFLRSPTYTGKGFLGVSESEIAQIIIAH